jgi:hypothetical protein
MLGSSFRKKEEHFAIQDLAFATTGLRRKRKQASD